MARRPRAMTGPGAGAMGGVGVRPARPPTAIAGRSPLAAPVGLPGPMPGGQPMGGRRPAAGPPGGGIGGAPGFARGGHVSAEKEEDIMEKKRKRHEALARGGPVVHRGMKPLDYPHKSSKADSQTRQAVRDTKPRGRHEEMNKQITEGKAGFKRGGAPGFTKSSAYNKGGYVDTEPPQSAPGRGIDTKPRAGRDTGKGSHGV